MHYEFPDFPAPGGAAFSSDSRYLYIAKWDSLYQFDMQAPDIFASRTLVGSYDGFLDERGLATRFFMLQLAPDGKIYISTSNYNSKYIHVIHQPNEAGTACQFEQRAIKLPAFNKFSLPNFPQYRLYEEPGSPCDSLTVSAAATPHLLDYHLFPNPAGHEATLHPEMPRPATIRIARYTSLGQSVYTGALPPGATAHRIPVGTLPPGHYTCVLHDPSGRVLGRRAMVVARR